MVSKRNRHIPEVTFFVIATIIFGICVTFYFNNQDEDNKQKIDTQYEEMIGSYSIIFDDIEFNSINNFTIKKEINEYNDYFIKLVFNSSNLMINETSKFFCSINNYPSNIIYNSNRHTFSTSLHYYNTNFTFNNIINFEIYEGTILKYESTTNVSIIFNIGENQ